MTYNLKELIKQGNAALKDDSKDGEKWSDAVQAVLEAVQETLIPFKFDNKSPIMLAVFCRLAGMESARIAQSTEHLYQGMEINAGLMTSAAAREWQDLQKARANDNAIRTDN